MEKTGCGLSDGAIQKLANGLRRSHKLTNPQYEKEGVGFVTFHDKGNKSVQYVCRIKVISRTQYNLLCVGVIERPVI